MPHPAPAKQETSAKIPYKKITTDATDVIEHILHVPGGQRIITCSDLGIFRVWDLETNAEVGGWEDEALEDEEMEFQLVMAIALSPDGKTIASGDLNSTVRLWNIDTGKVIKKWTGHTKTVNSVCWSSDGGRVVSGSRDGTFRVWDTESGRIILGPIKAGEFIYTVCYSPDAKMIATGGDDLRIWDANTGKLLTTIDRFTKRLVWTSDGKTLIAADMERISKFNTATWSETTLLDLELEDEERDDDYSVDSIVLSPNERILASTSYLKKTAQLWNLETNQPIEPPLHHEHWVECAAFSADGMFLLIGCFETDAPIYMWDLSTIVKDASLLSNNVDATR